MNSFRDTFSSKTRTKTLKKRLVKTLKIKNYKNLVEALYISRVVRRFTGVAAIEVEILDDKLYTKFSLIGFVFFLIWYSLFFYCTYVATIDDQTILRNIYSSRVQRYGDDCERIASIAYVILCIWKIPFCLSGNTHLYQIIVDADKALENLGEKVNYNKDAYSSSVISFSQMIVYLVRFFSIWLTLKNLNVPMPTERMYQVVFCDTCALIVTSYYCFTLMVLRSRFRYVNKVLMEINTRKAWECKLFVREKVATINMQKVQSLQEKYISEKIRSSAKIIVLLNKIVVAINDSFGLILVMTMLVSLMFIILYLFYFMEATGAGLFQDLAAYINFTMYVFWQAAFAIGILYLNVYCCECVMREASETPVIVHEIIHKDLGPSITTEAMQLSLQLLHQRPVFTAYGLYRLNYELFEQGARSVSTYLVILLQFVGAKL